MAILLLVASCFAAMSRRAAMKELRLSGTFDQKKLKSAYRTRSMATHPDKGGSTEAFLRVSEAYEVLSSGGGTGGSFSFTDTQRKFKEEDMSDEERVRLQAQMEAAMAEAMRRAEDMLVSVLEAMEGSEDVVASAIDAMLGSSSWSPGKWMLKSVLKSVGSMVKPLIEQAMESESTTVTINGRTMSGKEASRAFREWRHTLKQRADQRIGKGEL